MSQEKIDHYKKEKKNRKNGTYKTDEEQRSYRRDTIGMLTVLALLFLAPVGITVYNNYKLQEEQAAQMAEYEKLMQEMQATASNAVATPSEAEAAETEAETAESEEAAAEMKEDETDAATE